MVSNMAKAPKTMLTVASMLAFGRMERESLDDLVCETKQSER